VIFQDIYGPEHFTITVASKALWIFGFYPTDCGSQVKKLDRPESSSFLLHCNISFAIANAGILLMCINRLKALWLLFKKQSHESS
jgi:hypothetical protein